MSDFTWKILENDEEVLLIIMPAKVIGGTSNLDFTNFLEEIKNFNVKFVLVDLAKVEVINSIGLGLLVSAYVSLKKSNIALIFINVPEKVYQLLEVTHLLQIFTIKKNLQDFLETKSK